ncbi:MAG: phosphonate metabolism transcriptional regulator PhnF [Undibacterium sp.]|nr:phosphonate metabolism transcriptional regulator PhnF [Undibacterium sp.]
MISRGNGEAVYLQVRRQLESEIRAKHKPNDVLPSEVVLAERFGVNRHTLRRAVDGLVADGWVERRHGHGSFVLGEPINYKISQRTRFTENFAALGKKTESIVIRKIRIDANGGIAKQLALDAGEPVIWIETLRCVEQQPFCVISHYLPANLVPGLMYDYQGGSLHHFLEHNYGLRLQRSESLISSSLPQGDDARYLCMPAHSPILRVKSVNLIEDSSTPLEYTITRFRADNMQLRITT